MQKTQHTMTDPAGGARRAPRGIAAALILIGALACACSSPEPLPTIMLQKQAIVAQHATDALEVFFDLETERAPLQRFLDGSSGDRTEADLTRTWGSVPELADKGATFLEVRVFQKARADGDWAEAAPAGTVVADPKPVFVDGVRGAVLEFLAGDGEPDGAGGGR